MPAVTSVPLPDWRTLLFNLLAKVPSDTVLASPWCREGDVGTWLSRTSWSLALLTRWRKTVGQQERPNLWIPAFFCNSALVQVRAENVNLVFYPLLDSLDPDIEACRKIAANQKPDIFILVHYFGKPAVGVPARDFCQAHGAWLVEDAAHVLRPVGDIGCHGDMVLYSPHKHLPIHDGALLIVRSNGPSALEAPAFQDELSSYLQVQTSYRRTELARWWLKRILQKAGIRRRRFPVNFHLDEDVVEDRKVPPAMSVISRRMLGLLSGTLETVAESRRSNASVWGSLLTWIEQGAITEGFGTDASPYLIPVSCQGRDHARTIFNAGREAGYPVTSWPDLPPEIRKNTEAWAKAITLRESRIYLPCHQSVSVQQIIRAGRGIKARLEFFSHWEVAEPDAAEWDALWARCRHANLLQAREYGAAKRENGAWEVRRLAVGLAGQEPLAICQVLLRKIMGLGTVARVNRGPLLLNIGENHAASLKLEIIRALQTFAHTHKWRMLQIAPEIGTGEGAEPTLQAMGFRRLSQTPWGSALLSLETGEQELLMGLKGKWRNGMRKAVKHGLVVQHLTGEPEAIEILLENYAGLQQDRGFAGLSPGMIRSLARQHGPDWEFNLFLALREGDESKRQTALGTLVTIRSGDTCIYTIGTTTAEGRRLQANSLLLWQAVLQARATGCQWFDVGGLNADTPPGIAGFKQGLNATPYELIGEWRYWNLPLVS